MKAKTLLLSLLLAPLALMQAAEPTTFKNPILSGFHPDPSITRAGDTYYLVNSSFEWYPALPIHRSKDLVNWELIGYGVDRPEQMPFKDGLDDSGGTFAPTIRYHEGTFYLICTAVGAGGNFVLTAKDPAGPWSDPIWINTPGIDPSLFWEDGKCYYTGAANLHRDVANWPGANGAFIQEIDLSTGKMIGEAMQLTHGHATNARWTEGPHIFKVEDQYLLIVGEGGTGEQHAVTAFNSDKLCATYTPNFVNPVMTHRHLGYTYPIIQTGHADMVETQNGEWWSVMLAKRPVDGISMLARETFLAKVEMTMQESGVTPIFNPGVGLLQLEQERPNLPWTPVAPQPALDDFGAAELDLHWNFLRTPMTQWYTLKKGKLNLELRPQQVSEKVNPSFIAQRVKSHLFTCTTQLSFKTKRDNEAAGLVYYRNSNTHYQLLKTAEGIELIESYIEYGDTPATIVAKHSKVVATAPYSEQEVVLQLRANGTKGQFYYGSSTAQLQPIGEVQDISIIGDEKAFRFNGSYVGMYATSKGKASRNTASFDWFEQVAQ